MFCREQFALPRASLPLCGNLCAAQGQHVTDNRPCSMPVSHQCCFVHVRFRAALPRRYESTIFKQVNQWCASNGGFACEPNTFVATSRSSYFKNLIFHFAEYSVLSNSLLYRCYWLPSSDGQRPALVSWRTLLVPARNSFRSFFARLIAA